MKLSQKKTAAVEPTDRMKYRGTGSGVSIASTKKLGIRYCWL